MTINLNWVNVIIALIVCFTPFGVAQVQIYSDVQTLKHGYEGHEKYIEKSGAVRDEAVRALQELSIDIKYIKNELKQQREHRERFEQRSDEFYQLNPQLNRPK